MKHISKLLLFSLMFCGMTVFAQKNTLTLGAFYLPMTENTVAHASLGVYRQLAGNHSLGLKTMYSTNGVAAAADQIRHSTANVDLVHRWVFSKNNGATKLNLEAGISTAWRTKQIPPNRSWGFCGTGMTAEQMDEMQRYYEEVLSKWQVEKTVYSGLATAASWEIALSRHFGVGIGTTLNVYFSPKDGWQFLPMPNVNVAYAF